MLPILCWFGPQLQLYLAVTNIMLVPVVGIVWVDHSYNYTSLLLQPYAVTNIVLVVSEVGVDHGYYYTSLLQYNHTLLPISYW